MTQSASFAALPLAEQFEQLRALRDDLDATLAGEPSPIPRVGLYAGERRVACAIRHAAPRSVSASTLCRLEGVYRTRHRTLVPDNIYATIRRIRARCEAAGVPCPILTVNGKGGGWRWTGPTGDELIVEGFGLVGAA